MTKATHTGLVLAVMAVLALVETIAPFHLDGASRRRHLRANLGLTAAYLLLNFAFGVGAIAVFDALSARGFGLLSGHQPPKVALLAAGVVALDLSTFFAHWLMHRIPALWRVHRVHHSDPFVDVTTAFRQHPLEGLIRFIFTIAPAWALGLPVEAIALYRLVSATNALLEHANLKIWQPLDRALSLAIVTPNMHKVHHSRRQRETDSNYGNILSVFDRVFRTFTPTARAPTIEYGLDGYDTNDLQRVSKLMRLPFEGEAAAAVITARSGPCASQGALTGPRPGSKGRAQVDDYRSDLLVAERVKRWTSQGSRKVGRRRRCHGGQEGRSTPVQS